MIAMTSESLIQWKTEIAGGVIAFCTSIPSTFAVIGIMDLAGFDRGVTFTACCLSAGVSTILTSYLCRLPLIVAPNAALAALLVFSMYFGAGLPREAVLTAFGLSGVCLLALGFSKGGEAFIRMFPPFFTFSLTAGIGLLLIGTGLREAGVLVAHPVTLLVVGNLTTRAPLIAGIGVLCACAVISRQRGNPMVIAAITAFAIGLLLETVSFDTPSMTPMWSMTIHNLSKIPQPDGIEALRFVPSMLLILIFETAGVYVGVLTILQRDHGQDPIPSRRLWLCLGTAGILTPGFGAPGPLPNPEGLTGVLCGGKTWRTGLVAGGLFLLSLIIPPLAQIYGGGYQVGPEQWLHPLSSPLLIVGGLFCLSSLKHIDWGTPEEGIPAGLMCAIIPLTFSIVNGLGFGLLVYAAICTVQGNIRTLSPFYLIIIPVLMLRYLVL